MTDGIDLVGLAHTYGQVAHDAFLDQAAYLRSLPADSEHAPTGCADWDMQQLAGHNVGEAVWFANLVRTVTHGAGQLPADLWDQLKALSFADIAQRLDESAQSLLEAVKGASEEELQTEVDLGFAKFPLWQALYVCMMEAAVHDWDEHVGREPSATIPTSWAQELARGMVESAPMLANSDAAAQYPGTFLLDVSDGPGPLTLHVEHDGVRVERGRRDADVTIHLNSDQCVRLFCGRLPLISAIESGQVRVDGQPQRAQSLNLIFKGIGN